jgi:hypothetical protein
VWLQPGETLRRTFRSDQPLADPDTPAVSGSGAPLAAGTYVFAAMYRNREVTQTLRVARPSVESWRGVQVGTQFLYTYFLRMGEERIVGRDARARGEWQLAPGETLHASDLRGWVRVSEAR